MVCGIVLVASPLRGKVVEGVDPTQVKVSRLASMAGMDNILSVLAWSLRGLFGSSCGGSFKKHLAGF